MGKSSTESAGFTGCLRWHGGTAVGYVSPI